MRKILIICMAFILSGICMVKAQEGKNIFKYKVGNYELILLSEGQQESDNLGILIDATPEMIKETMPDGKYFSAVNTFLLKTPEKIYLFDTGFGRNLPANLEAVGVSPDDIHTVVLTHMHGDHTGGMIKEGANVFPNSIIQLSEKEKGYWTNDSEMNKLPENRRGGFTSARNILKAYEPKIQTVKPGKLDSKSGDGIFFIEAYGHTPGHMGCLIKSGKEQLLIWADLTHVLPIQMPYPQIAVTYDVIPEMAIESRKEILEYVAKNKIPVAGMHVPYPGIGNVEATSNGGYRFIPAK